MTTLIICSTLKQRGNCDPIPTVFLDCISQLCIFSRRPSMGRHGRGIYSGRKD
jgi:hypothetical protein